MGSDSISLFRRTSAIDVSAMSRGHAVRPHLAATHADAVPCTALVRVTVQRNSLLMKVPPKPMNIRATGPALWSQDFTTRLSVCPLISMTGIIFNTRSTRDFQFFVLVE